MRPANAGPAKGGGVLCRNEANMKKAEGMKIRILADGPYEVHGDVDINIAAIGSDAQGDSVSWKYGKKYEKTNEPGACETTNLCRCGHSRTKPFCDGSHDDAGFCGREGKEETDYIDRAEVQAGETVTLLDDPSLCVGARFCDVGESVWRYAQRSSDPEYREKAIDEACKCPAGRLTVVDADGNMLEPKLAPAISAVQDPINDCRGPLWVQGGIEIERANGDKYEVRNRVTLCRCGESTNQPYCDGSHYNCQHMRGHD